MSEPTQHATKMWSGRFRQGLTRCLSIFLLTCLSHSIHAEPTCPSDGRDSFTIYTDMVALPTGYFLLVRNADKIGAIRVTSVTQDTNTPSKVGEWIGTFDWESFYREGSTASFSDLSTIRRTGEVQFRRMVGIGFHSSHQPGNHFSRIGPWKFLFDVDRWVSISDWHGWSGLAERGFEVAPTSACDVTKIDVHDPRLHWYWIDPSRYHLEIPLSQLPHPTVAATEQRSH